MPENTARSQYEAQVRDTASDNAAAEARMASSTPTPTQEENDLAKLGELDIDAKEDDGSGPDPAVARMQALRELRRRQQSARQEAAPPVRRSPAPAASSAPPATGGSAA